ncbi:hypothetical protein A8C56_23060 [Niabella ginsenosidivorans]|uniref:Serine hydrolase n=1 Tax=Niabella ginsenosidivorans TaxID=1176587 RepID=A0A1A9I9S9_9BACT|nr:serine hydrolase [Niabella ginsenosidivorans]ANH83472.1 hypothetical protein A8C56_23060 [Niabella ginsenosidivorans]
MKRALLLLLLCLNAAFLKAQQASRSHFLKDSLDAYVNKALKDWQIPGAAVCVVKDGSIVLMKGYGIKETGTKESVDVNTLFMIGSNTKAFTATALAKLDAEGLLSLDDPVQKWLPDFTLYDPWVTKEATITDLLCHRLGFETFQGDFMFFASDLTVAEVREKLGKLKPVYSFRSKWGYTNSAFLTAGEVIPKATGVSWNRFITDSIFKPLGMNHSLALSAAIAGAADKASAHTIAEGRLIKIPYGKIDNLAPAGSISSSVNDLSHWVLMLLNNGKYEGKQVIPSSAIKKTRMPQSIIGNGGTLFNRGHFLLYGLGWMLSEYENREIVAHTGGVNGFVTGITLVPEEHLGIIVLTNTDANAFYEALKWELLDAELGLPYRGYSDLYFSKNKEQEAKQAVFDKKMADSVAGNLQPALELKAYAGSYADSNYGRANIQINGRHLSMTFEHHSRLKADLYPLGGNRFYCNYNDPLYGKQVLEFTVQNGKVSYLKLYVADFVEYTPYYFYKRD